MTQILELESKKKLIGDINGDINSVAFSPDGKYVTSGCSDNTVCIWNVASGEEKKRLEGHSNHVTSVAFSPDGKYVVSGSLDKTVRIWNVATEAVPKILKGHTDRINSVAFSPDGKYVASGSYDKTARIWNIETQKIMHILENRKDIVTSVAFSPDGKYMVYNDSTTACIFDVDNREVKKELEGNDDYINSVAFSPDGKYVVSGSEDRIVCIWNVNTETNPKILKGHSDVVRAVAFSPDGKYVVSGSLDNTIRIWDVILGKKIYKLEEKFQIVAVAFSPDITSGYTLAFIGNYTIHLYNLKQQISPFHTTQVKSPFHTSLNPTTSMESVSMPSKVYDFIEGVQSLSEYEYDIKDSDFPILFTDKKLHLKVMMKSRLENILKDNEAIFYECKAETKRTSLHISKENVHPQPYIKTTLFGIETVGDALIKKENIQKILKNNKKLLLKERQKQAIQKLGEEISIKEKNMTQSDMVEKAKSVLNINKIPAIIYTFVPTKITIDRVASKAVLEGGNVVGAKHCQAQYKMKVYTLRQVYKKRTKKRTYPKKSTSISRKNKSL